MISVLGAYRAGLHNAWREKKMIFLLYGFNLFFAYLITIPISMMLNKGFENRIAAADMLEKFDLTYFISIVRDFGAGLNLGRLIITFGLLYIILNTFFAGGILTIFHRSEKFDLTKFFSGCVEFFKRFLRLLLFSLLFFLLAAIIFGILSGLSSLVSKNAATDFWPFILFFIRLIVLLLLLAFFNMLFDYAKILTVVNDNYNMYQTIKRALKFVLMSLLKTTSLYFLLLITTILILVIYLAVEQYIAVSSALTVFIYFIWSQLFAVVRTWLRLSFFAGQYTFYRFSNTAIPGMTKEMLDQAIADYEKRKMLS